MKNFEAWNEKMARKYNPDKYHQSSNLIIRFIEGRRTAWIIKYLNSQKNDRIIELGCGAGNIMKKIKFAQELWGVDLSEFMLDISKQRDYQVPVRFIKGNLESLPEEVINSKFDKIYCSEVLEHVENPARVLKEMRKIAKANSVIVVSIPNEKLINRIKIILQKMGIFNFLFSSISKKMDDEWHLHCFDLKKLKEMIDRDYFIRDVQGIPYDWLPLRYVVKLDVKYEDTIVNPAI